MKEAALQKLREVADLASRLSRALEELENLDIRGSCDEEIEWEYHAEVVQDIGCEVDDAIWNIENEEEE
jgi:hypothetical protein